MAYKLAIPDECLIHPVSHNSCLKLKLGDKVVPILPYLLLMLRVCLTLSLFAILQTMSKQLRTRTIIEVLVQWHGQSVSICIILMQFKLELEELFPSMCLDNLFVDLISAFQVARLQIFN